MGANIQTLQEIRDFREQTPLQRAKGRHEEVIAICNHLVAALHAWGRLGRLCTLIERDHDWELLGYQSFGAWMMRIEEISGYSRAAAYQYMKLFRELEPHDIEGMSLGTAHVFKQLPAALQRSPEVLHAAKRMKPKEFREKIAKEHPESHVEMKEAICLNIDSSFAQMFHECVEAMRTLEELPELSYERAVEIAFASWMSEPWEDSGMSKLERARQLKALAI